MGVEDSLIFGAVESLEERLDCVFDTVESIRVISGRMGLVNYSILLSNGLWYHGITNAVSPRYALGLDEKHAIHRAGLTEEDIVWAGVRIAKDVEDMLDFERRCTGEEGSVTFEQCVNLQVGGLDFGVESIHVWGRRVQFVQSDEVKWGSPCHYEWAGEPYDRTSLHQAAAVADVSAAGVLGVLKGKSRLAGDYVFSLTKEGLTLPELSGPDTRFHWRGQWRTSQEVRDMGGQPRVNFMTKDSLILGDPCLVNLAGLQVAKKSRVNTKWTWSMTDTKGRDLGFSKLSEIAGYVAKAGWDGKTKKQAQQKIQNKLKEGGTLELEGVGFVSREPKIEDVYRVKNLETEEVLEGTRVELRDELGNRTGKDRSNVDRALGYRISRKRNTVFLSDWVYIGTTEEEVEPLIQRRLTEEKVKQIFQLFQEGVEQDELTKMFGVSYTAINDALNGVNWKHVKSPFRPERIRRKTLSLSEDDVRTIKQRLKSGEIMRTIAEDFGVAISTINNIKSGRGWKHIKD